MADLAQRSKSSTCVIVILTTLSPRRGIRASDSKRALRIALLHKPSAQSCKFGVANRPCLFQPTEFFNFICDAETNCAPDFVACLPSLLHVTLRHASSLKDQVCKHEHEWKYYPSYHPYCLDPAGDVVASE